MYIYFKKTFNTINNVAGYNGNLIIEHCNFCEFLLKSSLSTYYININIH